MAWTDERVDLLKKLWTEGLSAAQIANRLGGVTRNAVVGKVHRLGLSTRATTSRKPLVRRSTTGTKPARSAGSKPTPAATKKKSQHTGDLPEIFAGIDSDHLEGRPTQDYKELYIPPEERETVLTLKANNCRWPIGDPLADDFHFCGKRRIPDKSYCEHHANVAFQQPSTSKNTKNIRKKKDGARPYVTKQDFSDIHY
ncbi:MAG: GcrA cell cycle regulator [Alphaproteobacteria bacterium]|nr:GcrA cell cycle regulator [Alphaproteobacteria bacterium]MDD9919544.1 GcrA cell cycle regulator [Alphaproteobacteria bacterium]